MKRDNKIWSLFLISIAAFVSIANAEEEDRLSNAINYYAESGKMVMNIFQGVKNLTQENRKHFKDTGNALEALLTISARLNVTSDEIYIPMVVGALGERFGNLTEITAKTCNISKAAYGRLMSLPKLSEVNTGKFPDASEWVLTKQAQVLTTLVNASVENAITAMREVSTVYVVSKAYYYGISFLLALVSENSTEVPLEDIETTTAVTEIMDEEENAEISKEVFFDRSLNYTDWLGNAADNLLELGRDQEFDETKNSPLDEVQSLLSGDKFSKLSKDKIIEYSNKITLAIQEMNDVCLDIAKRG